MEEVRSVEFAVKTVFHEEVYSDELTFFLFEKQNIGLFVFQQRKVLFPVTRISGNKSILFFGLNASLSTKESKFIARMLPGSISQKICILLQKWSRNKLKKFGNFGMKGFKCLFPFFQS